MSRGLIASGSPFEAAYGDSRAFVDGGFVFVSDTAGCDYATMTMPEQAAVQAEACWRTIASVLAEAGSSLDRIAASPRMSC